VTKPQETCGLFALLSPESPGRLALVNPHFPPSCHGASRTHGIITHYIPLAQGEGEGHSSLSFLDVWNTP